MVALVQDIADTEPQRDSGVYQGTRVVFMTPRGIDEQARVDWLVPDLLPKRSYALLYGQSNSYKSFLALDLAMSVACGRTWCGKHVEPGSVVYLWGEFFDGARQRCDAWEKDRGKSSDLILLVPTVLAFTESADVNAFLMDLGGLPERPSLIIVDTLNQYYGADAERNNTDHMTRFNVGMKRIRDETGATVLVLHHANDYGRIKGNKQSFQDADIVMKTTYKRNIITLKVEKARDGKTYDGITFVPREVTLDERTTSMVLDLKDAGNQQSLVADPGTLTLKPVQQKILTVMQARKGDWWTVKQIAEAMESKVNTIRPYVYELAEQDRLR